MEESKEQPFVVLNNGIKMPSIGLGTYDLKDEVAKKSTKAAIMEVGYRHLDTAAMYENEGEIGEILKECFAEGLKRDEIFITTKILADYHDPEAAIKTSLAKLQLDYVDQYLIHAPLTLYDPEKNEYAKTPMYKVWAAMEGIYKKGLAKSIGLSNFNVQLILDLLTYAEVKPAVNQIELHPYLP